MTMRRGVVKRVPVPTRGVPFDVDLGPGAQGGVVAVYSRCAHEPFFAPEASYMPPAYRDGHGCDIYRFDFTSNRERKLRAVNTRTASEFLPTVWRGDVAFARVYERRRGLAGGRPHILLQRQGRRARKLRGGSRGIFVELLRRHGRRNFDGDQGPMELDLTSTRFAFSWGFSPQSGQSPRRCRKLTSEVDASDEPLATELWLTDRRGQHRTLVDRGCDYDPTGFVGNPTFTGGRLYYRRYPGETFGRAEQQICRRHLDTRQRECAPLPSLVTSLTQDGETTYYSKEEALPRKAPPLRLPDSR